VELGISGRVALVAASSRGLGRAAADALGEEGASVVICGRDARSLARAEAELAAAGVPVLALQADVTEPDAPRRLVAAALERFGRLDIVVPNAGGPPAGRALEVDDEAIERAVEANFLTSVRFVRAALPHLLEEGYGRICCLASYTVAQLLPTLALSNAARLGLWAWAKTAAHDLRGTGVTLNLVCPGPHATARMRELGGAGGAASMGDPADLGRVVAFLCSEPARHVNGATVVVDGGETLCR
jgi:3-oxoacyl-[acyl-carrier protein] reductase